MTGVQTCALPILWFCFGEWGDAIVAVSLRHVRDTDMVKIENPPKQGNSHNFTYMCENAQCNRTPRGIIQFPPRQSFLLLLFRLADSSPRLCSFPGAVFCAGQGIQMHLFHGRPLSGTGLNFRSWPGAEVHPARASGRYRCTADVESKNFVVTSPVAAFE